MRHEVRQLSWKSWFGEAVNKSFSTWTLEFNRLRRGRSFCYLYQKGTKSECHEHRHATFTTGATTELWTEEGQVRGRTFKITSGSTLGVSRSSDPKRPKESQSRDRISDHSSFWIATKDWATGTKWECEPFRFTKNIGIKFGRQWGRNWQRLQFHLGFGIEEANEKVHEGT